MPPAFSPTEFLRRLRSAETHTSFGGIDGSAYFIDGFGMTALTANNIRSVPESDCDSAPMSGI
jgi:hypothetical protein